jgi:hypothetical protein
MPRLRPVHLLRRFGRLGRAERSAIVRATILLVAVRIALAVAPFTAVLRFAARPAGRGQSRSSLHRLHMMVWAVDVVGNRLFPRNPCLVQALVVQRLFIAAGQPAELRIGVRREGASRIAAHAWVENAGTIVIGGRSRIDEYTPLPPITPGSQPWGN